MPVTLRPATATDEAFLLRLTAQLAAFDVPRWRTAAEIAEADHRILREALARPDERSCLRIAELDGRPAGYVFCSTRRDYFTGEPHGHVEVLAVDPSVQGQGIGRTLMEAAEAWARGRGYRVLTLNVFDRNRRARTVYERLGYEPETIHYLKRLDG